jgi:hypothetical protein
VAQQLNKKDRLLQWPQSIMASKEMKRLAQSIIMIVGQSTAHVADHVLHLAGWLTCTTMMAHPGSNHCDDHCQPCSAIAALHGANMFPAKLSQCSP